MARQKMLLVDWREIQCGPQRWRMGDGVQLGVGNPPEPSVPLQLRRAELFSASFA